MTQLAAYQESKCDLKQNPVAVFLHQAVAASALILDGSSSQRKRVEAVHDLRVALRRLNVTAKVFAAKLPSSVSRKLKVRSKKLRRYAGELRDTDITISMLIDMRKHDGVHVKACELLMRHLDRRRPKLLAKLHRALLRPKCRRLWLWIEDTVLPELGTSTSSNSDLQMLAEQQVRESQLAFSNAKAIAEDHGAMHLHALRIAAKRLRYVIELFADYGIVVAGSEMRDDAEDWQNRLGKIQDLLVARNHCESVAAKAAWTTTERLLLIQLTNELTERHLCECATVPVASEGKPVRVPLLAAPLGLGSELSDA